MAHMGIGWQRPGVCGGTSVVNADRRGMLKDAAVQALEEVADALKDAQHALHVAEAAARKGLRRKDGGLPNAASLRADPVNKYRPAVDEALTRLEQSRHKVLVAIFAVALEDGMSIGELGRNYGFSRQLASRYAKEARCRMGGH
jgi:hypothetical protein